MSRYTHVKFIDLYNNGVEHQVIVLGENKGTGDSFIIPVKDLDDIDFIRMQRILKRRELARMPLWDVLDNITLPNGVNALDYFHQLVWVHTRGGQLMRPDARRRSVRRPRQTLQTVTGETAEPSRKASLDVDEFDELEIEGLDVPEDKPTKAKRRGRPPAK